MRDLPFQVSAARVESPHSGTFAAKVLGPLAKAGPSARTAQMLGATTSTRPQTSPPSAKEGGAALKDLAKMTKSVKGLIHEAMTPTSQRSGALACSVTTASHVATFGDWRFDLPSPAKMWSKLRPDVTQVSKSNSTVSVLLVGPVHGEFAVYAQVRANPCVRACRCARGLARAWMRARARG